MATVGYTDRSLVVHAGVNYLPVAADGKDILAFICQQYRRRVSVFWKTARFEIFKSNTHITW